jgi:hypothetical protein
MKASAYIAVNLRFKGFFSPGLIKYLFESTKLMIPVASEINTI